jgi:hypothetical protein
MVMAPVLAAVDALPGPMVLGQSSSAIGRTVVLILALLGAALVLGLVLMWVRRELFGADRGADAAAGFGPTELRRMRDRGEITDQEYQQAVQSMTRMVKQAKERAAEGKPGPPGSG